jgi:hypothetical protein
MQYGIQITLYFKTTVLAAALKKGLAPGDTRKTQIHPRGHRFRNTLNHLFVIGCVE